jgi:CubicO group peptidase (beta-lactamase class C family)
MGLLQASTRPSLASEQVDQIVRPLIDLEYAHGVVVGIFDEQGGPRILTFGTLKDDAVFEIGSVTKVFTSLLLADAAQDGTLKLSDPVQNYLPESVQLAQRGGRPMTLVDLATHRSGLPRLPDNLDATNLDRPYESYSAQNLYEFLRRWQPSRAPGSESEYSNLGAGLLGHLLARRAGVNYEELVARRIFGPLGMNASSAPSKPPQHDQLGKPHDADGNVVPAWIFSDALGGAGAIRSTAGDMLRFLQAQLDPPKTSLGQAIRLSQARQNQFVAGNDIGLGWLIDRRGFLWHNGETRGFHSFAAFSPEHHAGVVVLCDTAAAQIDSVGMQLICRQIGAGPGPLPRLRKAILLNQAQLDRLAGSYAVLGTALGLEVLQIRRDGDRLFAELGLRGEHRIYPESESTCFWKVEDLTVNFFFEPGAARAQRLELHLGDSTFRAARTGPLPAPSTKGAL